MENKLKDIFPKIKENGCLKILNDKEFEIYDCTKDDKDCEFGKCYIKKNGNFKVINNFEKKVGFLAIDKCIFFDDDKFKKCDCLIFDDKIISFIEIKNCKTKNRRMRKKDVKEQLKKTIEIFKSKIDIDKNIEAYLCLGFKTTNPSKLSSNMDSLVEFEEELNTKLFEGCQKEIN